MNQSSERVQRGSRQASRPLRLALLSDVHGNAWALRAVLDDAARLEPDAHLVLGDLVADGPAPAETLDLLRDLFGATFVQGNTDRYLANLSAIESWRAEISAKLAVWEWAAARIGEQGRRFLGELPHSAHTHTPSGRLLAVHGLPGDDEGWVDPERPETLDTHGGAALLVGHSHEPYVVHTPGGIVVNPGSVGLSPITGWRASWALVDALPGGHLRVRHRQVEWDTPAYIRACHTNGMPIDPRLQETLDKLSAGVRSS